MTAAEIDVIATLLGRKTGSIRTPASHVRDVIGGRQHKVCLALEAAGIGKVEQVNAHAFTFKTHAQIADELRTLRRAQTENITA